MVKKGRLYRRATGKILEGKNTSRIICWCLAACLWQFLKSLILMYYSRIHRVIYFGDQFHKSETQVSRWYSHGVLLDYSQSFHEDCSSGTARCFYEWTAHWRTSWWNRCVFHRISEAPWSPLFLYHSIGPVFLTQREGRSHWAPEEGGFQDPNPHKTEWEPLLSFSPTWGFSELQRKTFLSQHSWCKRSLHRKPGPVQKSFSRVLV